MKQGGNTQITERKTAIPPLDKTADSLAGVYQ